MRYIITFSFRTAAYSIHANGCSAAHANKNQTAWNFDGTEEEAVFSCHADEQEKGGEWANVRVCKCAK